jgi:mono/diheme cytochrome c family protein
MFMNAQGPRYKTFVSLLGLTLPWMGCKQDDSSNARLEPNYLYAAALEIAEESQLEKPLMDSQELLVEWFGTLDHPKLPPLMAGGDYKDLINLEGLKIAAGQPAQTPEPGETGLYRHQCASCHGESGQGRGPVAASQNPYPREFRFGLFKYKSTPRRYKPTKADLAKSIRRGLAGTQMRAFDKLTDKQVDALVDYVIYLSIRGEFERKLIFQAAYELDLEKERIYSSELAAKSDDESKKTLKSQLDTAEEILTEIVDMWVESPDMEEEVKLPSIPLVGSVTDDNRGQWEASVARGKTLFASEEAACSKCHGVSAKGDGAQLPDYDDWTKDWTSKIGIKPTNTEELLPLMARGGMKPQPLAARNLVEGKFRGGRDPKDIYRRIKQGIVGAPMPAATIVSSPDQKGLTEDDVWHIVNYVLSIAEPEAPALASK